MAKYRCPCGAQIRTSGEIPNPDEWLLISDTQFESVRAEPIAPEILYPQMIHAWKCSDCGRLLIFWDDMANDPIWYEPFVR